VVEEEEKEEGWAQLFQRAKEAGLNLSALRGVTSDGSHALLAYLKGSMGWVNHQRCVWHLWRSLAEVLKAQARAATEGLVEAVAASARQQVGRDLASLMRAVFNAVSYEQAEAALAKLKAHPWGEKLARVVSANLDTALMHSQHYKRGQSRVAPEYLWRDFRLRLS
jgi:transposase-like protein